MTKRKTPDAAKPATVAGVSSCGPSPASAPNSKLKATGGEGEGEKEDAAEESPFRLALSSTGVPLPVWKESGVVPLRATRRLPDNNVQAGERFGSSLDAAAGLILKGVAVLDPEAAVLVDGLAGPAVLTEADAPHGAPIASPISANEDPALVAAGAPAPAAPLEVSPGRASGGNKGEGSDSRPAPANA